MPQPLQPRTDPETEYILVITGLPDKAQAASLAHKLIEERLAACISIQGECTSIYRWQGRMESGVEVPVFIKTVAQHYSSVASTRTPAEPVAADASVLIALATAPAAAFATGSVRSITLLMGA